MEEQITDAIQRPNVFAAVERGAAFMDRRNPTWFQGLSPLSPDETPEAEEAFKAFSSLMTNGKTNLDGLFEFAVPQAGEEDLPRYTPTEGVDGPFTQMLAAAGLIGTQMDIAENPSTLLDIFYLGLMPNRDVASFGIPANTGTKAQNAVEGYCPVANGRFLAEAWNEAISTRQRAAQEAA